MTLKQCNGQKLIKRVVLLVSNQCEQGVCVCADEDSFTKPPCEIKIINLHCQHQSPFLIILKTVFIKFQISDQKPILTVTSVHTCMWSLKIWKSLTS